MDAATPQAPALTIKEVARRTGLAPSTIRYYDQQFEEFLGVRRGNGRRRLFDAQAVERLLLVQRLLKEQGLSLRQARQSLSGAPAAQDAQEAAGNGGEGELEMLRSEVGRLRAEMEQLERRVRELRDIQQRTLALVGSLTRS